MKTKHNRVPAQGSELQSRPEQPSSSTNTTTQAPPAPAAQQPSDNKPARILPYVNYAQRETNRSLSTDRVLDLLRRWLPGQYDLAEIVGQWIWITFPEQPAEQVRGQLSQFGFHWNNSRKCWQHPCGQFRTEGSGEDPRQRYGSRFAADRVAA